MHATDKRAVTDVESFVTDLEGGLAAQQLSVALSETAAAVVDHNKKGSVTLKLDFELIKGTRQVRVEHKVTFERPTSTGKAGETASGASVLHVSKGGRLTLAQPDMYHEEERRQTRIPGAD
jgi:hypothetical protein